jgi:hypothetical protein
MEEKKASAELIWEVCPWCRREVWMWKLEWRRIIEPHRDCPAEGTFDEARLEYLLQWGMHGAEDPNDFREEEDMSFNWESDTEPLEDRYCRCGQRYKVDLYPEAQEAHYAVTARPVIDPDSDTNYERLDADETICVSCGEDVPFNGILIEGPITKEMYKTLSESKPTPPSG